MKFACPELNSVFSFSEGMVNTLVIENPCLLYRMIEDIRRQENKLEGEVVFSKNNEPIDICKGVELLTDVYGIDLNAKNIVNKIVDELSKKAVDEVHYEKTMQTISYVQAYFEDLVWDIDCEIECTDIVPKQLLKALNFSIVDDGNCLPERIIKYVELVRQFIGDKLFVFVNFRSFISEKEFVLLTDTLIEHGFQTLFIDNKEYPRLSNEMRLTVDIDMCEF